MGPLAIAEPSGRATISGDLDLRSWNLQIRTAFEEARAGKFWTGSAPGAVVTIRGALDASTRVIDVAGLVAGLATQAIARESERIAGLEADMRERAFFNRVLKSGRFLSGRAAEIAAYQAEQTRLKSEADRRRVEASLLKAYADQMKAKTSDSKTSDPAVDPKAPAPASPPDPTAGGLY
jgi:hypothetical protein